MKIIFVGHLKPAIVREFDSLWEAAEYDGLNEETFENLDQMIEVFGDSVADLPEGWENSANTVGFPAVHVYNDGETTDFWLSKKDFESQKEQIAREFFWGRWQSVIPVENNEEAYFYATQYTGEREREVKRKAWEILRLEGEYENAKKRQIKSAVDSGEITFINGDRLIIFYSSYKSVLEKVDDEWVPALFEDNDVLKMLEIENDSEMILFLLQCLGVK